MKEHWELLAALRGRDPQQVEDVSSRHNRRAQEAYRRTILANPQVNSAPTTSSNAEST